MQGRGRHWSCAMSWRHMVGQLPAPRLQHGFCCEVLCAVLGRWLRRRGHNQGSRVSLGRAHELHQRLFGWHIVCRTWVNVGLPDW